MPNVNNFKYLLTFGPDSADEITFMDASAIAKMPDEFVGNLLSGICERPSQIDFSKTLAVDQCMWVYTAAHILKADCDVRVLDSDMPFKDAFRETQVRNIPGWRNLCAKVEQAKPTSLESLRSALKSLLGSVRCATQLSAGRTADFKNDVLYRFPANLGAENFDLMRRRFVDNLVSGVEAVSLANPDTGRQIFILNTDNEARLTGVGSPMTIGLGSAFFANQAQLSRSTDPTDVALLEAQNVAAVSDLGLENSVLKPTSQAKFDQAVALGQSAARKIIDDQSLSAESAAKLKASLDVSIDTLLRDPTSPYFNKGYTQREMIAIATESLFGVEGVSQMRKDIAQGLKSSMEQAESAQAALDIFRTPLSRGFSVSNDGTVFPDDPTDVDESLIAEVTSALDTSVENYNNLLHYGSILYDIQAPSLSDSSARSNPAPLAVAGYVALSVLVASPIIYHILNTIKTAKDNECIKIESALGEANKRLAESLAVTINEITTEEAMNSIVRFLSANQGRVQPQKDKLKELECGTHYVPGLDCLSSAIQSWSDLTTFQAKKEAIKSVVGCLDANCKFLDKVVADTKERIAKRDESDIFVQWGAFLSKLPKIGSSILTYAAYTALGLGVIWGAGKVYRALKVDNDDA